MSSRAPRRRRPSALARSRPRLIGARALKGIERLVKDRSNRIEKRLQKVKDRSDRIEKRLQKLADEVPRLRSGLDEVQTDLETVLDEVQTGLETRIDKLQRRQFDLRETLGKNQRELGKSMDKGTRAQAHLQRRVTQLELLIARERSFDDDAFLELAAASVEDGRSMLGFDRLWTLWQAAENASRISGTCAEVGVFRGGTLRFIAEALHHFDAPDVEIHGFDVFEGPAPPDMPEEKLPSFERDAAEMTIEDVREYLSGLDAVHLHKGPVSADSLSELPHRSYGLVHVDVNDAEPTLDSLRYFGPRMAAGGAIVLDDYGAPGTPGVAEAVQAFRAEKPRMSAWRSNAEQVVLVALGS